MIELGSQDFWDRLEHDPSRLAAEICSIDVVNLDLTLQQQAALRAWVNAQHEAARIREAECEWEVTKARARALLKAREIIDPFTGKSKIADVLKAEVELDALVMKWEKFLSALQVKRGVLRAMSGALEDRLQMLIQISAKQRAERRDPT